MKEDILHTALGDVHLEEGVLYTVLTVEEMTLELIKAHVAAIKAHFGASLPLPSITESGKMKSGTKESRDYSAGAEMATAFSCNAMIASSVIGKTLGNLFILFSKPKTPTKLFTDKSKALEWAKGFAAKT